MIYRNQEKKMRSKNQFCSRQTHVFSRDLMFLYLNLSNIIISTKTYDKRDDFDFDLILFPFFDEDVPCATTYGVYNSQLIRLARTFNEANYFNI